MMVEPARAVESFERNLKREELALKTELKRAIPFSILFLLGINAIIGTGIFFVPGIAARLAGPASLISWVLVAIIAFFIAACFGELSSMFPRCGGVYEYTKQAFGEFGGFITGWTSWIVANVTIAMLSIGALDYLGVFFNFAMWQKILLAILFVLGMNYLSFRGIDMSVKVLLIFAIVTIISLWTLFSWGIYYFDISNIMPLSIFPKVSIVIAMLYIMETFFGWETVSFLAEETKEPVKVIPKVMIWSTLAVVLLALGVVAVTLGAVPWQQLAQSSSPLVDAAAKFMGQTGAKAIAILVFLNIIGGAAAWIVVTPRLIFALARDRLLPDFLSKVHEKHKTPHNAILFQTILTVVILLSGSYLFLLETLLPLAIFMYAMVIVSVSILRYTQPQLPRPFKVPFGKVLPIIVALIMVFLAGGIEPGVILSGMMFVLLGIPLYLLESFAYRPKVAKEIINIASGATALTETSWFDYKLRKHIIKFLGDVHGKDLILFRSDAPIFALQLARLVGPNGRLYVTHISQKVLSELMELANKHKISNIEYILERAEARDIFYRVSKADGLISIGALGYLLEPEMTLKYLSQTLRSGAKIYFIEYDKLFKFISTRPWLQDPNKIVQYFLNAGFIVKVYKQKRFLWNVIHIYGYRV